MKQLYDRNLINHQFICINIKDNESTVSKDDGPYKTIAAFGSFTGSDIVGSSLGIKVLETVGHQWAVLGKHITFGS
jgi:hypothetical protein